VVAEQAWYWASRLGIHPTLLSPQGITSSFCEYDLKGRLASNNACGRRIALARKIDGVDFLGVNEGFRMEFGTRGQVRSFHLVWPRLEPYQNYATASPSEIIRLIRAFKTALRPPDGDEWAYFPRIKDLAKTKKLTITRVKPFYAEGFYGEQPRDNEPTRFVTPVAELEAVAELDRGNVSVRLYSPFTSGDVKRFLNTR
jgi:hypothetical protein